MNPQVIMHLHKVSGCSLLDCRSALNLCNGNEGVAYEYLKIKSSAVNRKKRVNGRWYPWSDKDYVVEARKRYYSTIQE